MAFKHSVGHQGAVGKMGTIHDILHSFDVGERVQVIKIEDNGISPQHYLCRSSETGETQWLTEEQFIPEGEE